MISIKLYGHLGKQYGKLHNYTVRNPLEALRALEANYRGFKQSLLDKAIAGYKIIVDGQDRSYKEQLEYPADTEIKIVPIVKGSGSDSSWISIVIGVVLIVVAWWNPYGWGELAVGVAGPELVGGGAYISAMYAVGTALVLSGVSGLLMPKPTVQDARYAEENSGKYFNGPANMSLAGSPVPLAYGKVMTGSVVVHATISTSEG